MAQLQGGQGDVPAGLGQVVLVGAPDLLDQAMQVQPLKQSGDLRARAVGEDTTQAGVAKSADLPFAPHEGDEEFEVVGVEQVEAPVTPLLLANRLGQPLDLLDRRRGVGQVGEEGDVAAVGSEQQLSQGSQAVNRLLHGGELGLSGVIPVFHHPVVAKEGDVVDRRLDAQDQALLVVELDGHWPHVVLETGALDPSVEVVAEFIPVVAGELAPEEGGDVVRLDRVDGSADQGVIQGMQIGLAMEDDIGGVLHLHDAPVVGGAELAGYRAVAGGEAIQGMMEPLDGKDVGEGPGSGPIGDAGEGVVQLRKGDAGLLELGGQPVVAVAVELEPERGPGGHPEIAQAELGVDEVEVVVEALPVLVAQGGLPGSLVMPGGEGGTWLHGREDVDEAGLITSLLEDSPNAIFLAEGMDRPDELDLQAVLPGDPFSVLSDLVTQGLGEARIVEETNPVQPQVGRHALGEANPGESARDDDPIKAREDTSDLGSVAFCQQRHASTLLSRPSGICRGLSVSKHTSFLVSALPS